MSQHVHLQQAPPRSWEQFEELCADTFQEEWQDSGLVRQGRPGQAQQGVDIVGRDGAIWPVGVQCKRKSTWPISKVTTQDIDRAVEEAKKFKPKLKRFYLVSTAPDNVKLQEHARGITERHRKVGLFDVAVLGWDDLVRRITKHKAVAAEHFGEYSSGPARPLLATWRTSAGKILLSERELHISIRELILDLRDYPAGRLVLKQDETESLLLKIRRLQAKRDDSLAERERLLTLRDQLRTLQDRESRAVAGLMLLFADKDWSGYVNVWDEDVELLVRAFVEQTISTKSAEVTGMEKFRIHAPALLTDKVAVFIPPELQNNISEHHADLNARYPNLRTDNVHELPKAVKFGYALPTILRETLANIDQGTSMEEMKKLGWLDLEKWRVTP